MKEYFKLMIMYIIGLTLGIMFTYAYMSTRRPQTELPIGWETITKETPIIGYYKQPNTFHVTYDHHRIAEIENRAGNVKFEWEGLDKDIPADGIVTVQFKTNKNTVYINPVDK